MSVTYTNRKGLTYYLCRGTTKTGKPRYYFAREIKDEPVAEIPEGYRISESVNGIVSLVKDRSSQILPEEIKVVEAAVARHPKAHNYQVSAKHNRIDIYERVGPDAEDLIAALAQGGLVNPGLAGRVQAERERYSQFTPVLRFILIDAKQRTFGVQRMCYLGSVDDWIDIEPNGPVERLVRKLIPTLGTDEAFLEAIIDTLYETFKAGESVTLPGLGGFYVRPEQNTWVFKFNPGQKLRAVFGWSSTHKGEV